MVAPCMDSSVVKRGFALACGRNEGAHIQYFREESRRIRMTRHWALNERVLGCQNGVGSGRNKKARPVLAGQLIRTLSTLSQTCGLREITSL